MKKVISFVLCAVLLIGAISLIGCTDGTQTANAASYVTIDINPSVELVVDGNNIVVGVNALNVDGEIMLEGLNLIGLDIEAASDLYIAKAAELGYIDVDATETDPNQIVVTVVSDNLPVEEDVRERICARVDNFLLNHGIWGVVFTKEQKDEIKTQANELGISVGKMKMIESILIAYPEKTVEELKNLSVKELVELVKAKNPALTLMENYRLRKEQLEAIEIRTDQEQAELEQITAILENNEELRANLLEKMEQRQAKAKAKFDRMQENRAQRKENIKKRWQQFKNNNKEK